MLSRWRVHLMYRDVGGKSRRLLRRKLLREYVISLHLYLLAILFLGRYILQRHRVSFKVVKEGEGAGTNCPG